MNSIKQMNAIESDTKSNIVDRQWTSTNQPPHPVGVRDNY